MIKIIVLFFFMLAKSEQSKAQLVQPRTNFFMVPPSWQFYVTNSPGTGILDTRMVATFQDSSYMQFTSKRIVFDSLRNSVRGIRPISILHTNDTGQLITSSIDSLFIPWTQILSRPTIPTATSQLTNNTGWITTSGARTAITLTNTGIGAATYNPSTGILNIPTASSGTVSSVGGTSSLGHLSISNSPITSSGNMDFNLTTTGVSAGTYDYVTIDAYGRVINAYNEVTNTLSSRIFGTAYQASNTSRSFDLDFTVRIDIGAALVSLNSGYISVETSSSSSGPWTEYTRVLNGNGGIASALNQQGVQVVARGLSAGTWYRLTTGTATGTVTYTYITGHEILKK